MRDFLDRFSWPARRWLADRLVGHHAYSRNVMTLDSGDLLRNDHTGEVWMIGTPTRGRTPSKFPFKPFDQDVNTRSPKETA